MIVTGGEVSFVQRMMRESITSRKVLWWTCMLGKLSSVVTLSGELKQLAMQQKVAGWGVHELHTGGGKTKRWVIMWTVAAATGLRIPDVSMPLVVIVVVRGTDQHTLRGFGRDRG